MKVFNKDKLDIDILIKNFLEEEEISKTSYEHHLKMDENDMVNIFI